MIIEAIGFFHSPLKGKFGLPRQAGLAPDFCGEVRFVAPYDAEEAVRGLDGFDYCWLLWGFSLNANAGKSLTVRPPRLGGNVRVGVFASRSPFRPNSIGLSCVKLVKVSPGVLYVSGADLADGTPVYDVKPYIPYADSRPEARSGFVDTVEWTQMDVVIPAGVACLFAPGDLDALRQLLSQDPRPQYHDDADRVYGLTFAGFDVRFRVHSCKVFVLSAEKY